MSKWREKALELFPDLEQQVQAADSVGALWVELGSRFNTYYRELIAGKRSSPDIIRAIYQYATWCTRADSDGTREAAYIGFYEDLPRAASEAVTREQMIEDLIRNIGLPEVRELAGTFSYSTKRDELAKFLADCEETDRKLRRRSQRKKL